MVHLEQYERTLLNKSSHRELALYRLLEGKKHSFIPRPNDLEDALCSKSFNREDASNELKELRKIKPFKGFHYSNNLITLIAASLASEEAESANVSNYLSTHSFRDAFIFSKALGKEFHIESTINNSIDNLAQKLIKNKIITEDDISNCVTAIADLFDLYIVKQAISLHWLQYQNNNNIDTYKEINNINGKIVKNLNRSFAVFGFLICCWLLTYISPLVVEYATKNWDQLEPIAYLLDKALLIVSFFCTYKFFSSENAKQIAAKHYLSFFYRLLGVNYSDLINLNQKLKNGR